MTAQLRFAILLLAGLAAGPVVVTGGVEVSTAQPAPDLAALNRTIERIYGTADFTPAAFSQTEWFDGGRRFVALEPSDDGLGRDLVSFDTATGAREVLVPAAALVPPGASEPLAIASYAWSADRARLLVFTNTRRVWRQNTRGDYWVLDRAAGTLSKLGGSAPEASLMFAKFSPDGSRVGWVRDGNLYVEDLESGAITPVTTDGGGDLINGTSDWVNEEEFGIRDGFRWSPDGRFIAYWRFDTSGVGRFTLINNTDTLYPEITVFPYPKVGTVNSAVSVHVADLAAGRSRRVATPGDPRNTYIPRMEWADADTLMLQHMNRLQNVTSVLLARPSDGAVTRVFEDRSSAWLDAVDDEDVEWLSGGGEFTWVSEKDGWRHVYAIARDGSRERLLTRFDGDAMGINAIDTRGGRLYFTASPGNATERYLYMSRLDGDGSVTRVTPAAEPGTHSYDISPDGHWAIHTWSRFEVPPAVELVSLPDHRTVRTLVDNRELARRMASLLEPAAEFVSVDIGGGIELDGWVIRPGDFDPSKRYPLIVHVYGEPASTTVNNRWGGSTMLFHRAIADQGFVVVSFDNRGTPAPKGAAWRHVVYGTVGDLSSKDQAAAVRAFAASRPWVDVSRVGVWGWSGGGSNTLNCLFRFPGLFDVGVSVAPVPDQRLYDTIYQERYMGVPQGNAEGYRIGSPINFAEGLEGDLLVIHGSGDDNVHAQGAERLVNRLVELGKRFEFMLYPNRTHAIAEGPGTTVDVRKRIAGFLVERMAALQADR
jgi:dipeptidyl-peptidase-4